MNMHQYDDAEIAGWIPFSADLEYGATILKGLLKGQHPGEHRNGLKAALFGIRREQMRRFRLDEDRASEQEPLICGETGDDDA